MTKRNHKSWLLVATKPEWGPLKTWGHWQQVSKNPAIYRLVMNEQEILLVQLGLGPQKAGENLKIALAQFSRPDRIVHFGISGALVPSLQVGDLFAIHKIVNEDGREIILKTLNPMLPTATLLTVSGVLFTPSEKQKSGEKFEAHLVDMESFPCAQICQENQIDYGAIRSVFDPMETDLSYLSHASSLKENGDVSLKGLAEGIVKKPKLLLEFPHLKKASNIAIQNSCQLIQQIVCSRE